VLHADGVRRLAIAIVQRALDDLHNQDAGLADAARRFLTRPSDDLDRWVTLAGLRTEAIRQRVRTLAGEAEERAA
jgi:hypothetical protein